MSEKSLKDRLSDPGEIFSQAEVFQAFEALADQYGFHRNPDLPPKGSWVVETAAMTVPHFEDKGVLIVKPLTVRDITLTIPSIVDELLGNNLNPSLNTRYNAQIIATFKAAVVGPIGIAELLLNSTDQDLISRSVEEGGEVVFKNFFAEFALEYDRWSKERTKEVNEKKSMPKQITEDGNESVS